MAELRVGLISDTHGLLRAQAVDALRGSDLIVHAGDIVDPGILDSLRRLAPVTAVRGNNDCGAWAEAVPQSALLEVGGLRVFVVHDLAHLPRHPPAAGCDVIVTGHSHQPRIERRGSVLFVNPGSAGPRRFTLPVTVGRLLVTDGRAEASIVPLA
jgi:putative phosphoesterase